MGPSLSSAAAAANVISNDAFTEDSYCDKKFLAIRERTSGTIRPPLKEPDSGDTTDHSGSCIHDPLAEEEAQAQLLQLHHCQVRAYMIKRCDQNRRQAQGLDGGD